MLLNEKYANLIHVLGEKGIAKEKQLKKLLFLNSDESFLRSLVDNKYVTEEQLIQIVDECYGIPYTDLSNIDIELCKYIPYSSAKMHNLVPFKRSGDILYVAMENPLDRYAIEDIRILSSMDIVPYIALRRDIERAIDIIYGNWNLAKAITDYQSGLDNLSMKFREEKGLISEHELLSAPVVKIFDVLLNQGIESNASDMHLEPFDGHGRVRFRIDGEIYNIMEIPKDIYDALISRIKILANLDIAEQRQPQDGRVLMPTNQGDIDIRISITPTIFGEKAVLRLLNKSKSFLTKDKLGLSKSQMDKLTLLLGNKRGIVLVSGPTGCGKTTTLYAMLRELNIGNNNIITIEDPVEYTIYGVNQMQVNRKVGFGFAEGLRAALRQDPDIIMVGEIRDKETAEIAIRAAITGHLVFSTLHTNDAVGSIIRLIDMGIESYLLGASIVGIISQRLLKVLCPKCKKRTTPSLQDIKLLSVLGVDEEIYSLYRPMGCNYCNFKGYKGRTAVFEILIVTRDIKYAILEGTDEDTIKNLAVNLGMKTIKEQCLELLFQGITDISEVLRTIYSNDLMYNKGG